MGAIAVIIVPFLPNLNRVVKVILVSLGIVGIIIGGATTCQTGGLKKELLSIEYNSLAKALNNRLDPFLSYYITVKIEYNFSDSVGFNDDWRFFKNWESKSFALNCHLINLNDSIYLSNQYVSWHSIFYVSRNNFIEKLRSIKSTISNYDPDPEVVVLVEDLINDSIGYTKVVSQNHAVRLPHHANTGLVTVKEYTIQAISIFPYEEYIKYFNRIRKLYELINAKPNIIGLKGFTPVVN